MESAVSPGSTVDAAVSTSGRDAWTRALTLWHLCSLDAPTVAVVWAMALGWTAGLHPQPAVLMVLALGTWIVYVLDRLLDGLGPGSARLQARHYFHRRHQKKLLCLCGVAALALTSLCCESVPGGLVYFYLVLGIPVAIYALLVHCKPVPGQGGLLERRGRKEGAVAVLFTAAVVAPTFAAATPGLRLALLPTTLLLAGLCFLNCTLISHVEEPRPLHEGGEQRHPWALNSDEPYAAAQGRRLTRGASWLAALAAAGFLATVFSGIPGGAADAGVLVAALLLRALLGLHRNQADAHRLRVMADLALLTPVPFLLVHLLRLG